MGSAAVFRESSWPRCPATYGTEAKHLLLSAYNKRRQKLANGAMNRRWTAQGCSGVLQAVNKVKGPKPQTHSTPKAGLFLLLAARKECRDTGIT